MTHDHPQTDDAALGRLQHELMHPPFHDFLKPEAVSVHADNGACLRRPYRSKFRRSPVAVLTGRMMPTSDLRTTEEQVAASGSGVYSTRAPRETAVAPRGNV